MKCAKKHAVVWAKSIDYPYWPAKLICINEDGLNCVRYFGDHSMDILANDKICPYSEDYPEECSETELFLAAKQVCNPLRLKVNSYFYLSILFK